MEARLGPAKGKDSATSLGPWMVTTDELAPYIHDGRLYVYSAVVAALWLSCLQASHKRRSKYGHDNP